MENAKEKQIEIKGTNGHDSNPIIVNNQQNGLIRATIKTQNQHRHFEIKEIFQHIPFFRSKQHDWSYEGQCGPQTWAKSFTKADGKYQSPVNIDTEEAVYDAHLLKNKLIVDYEPNCCSQIKNTGHTFQVDAFPNNNSKLKGGPLKHEYNFLQFHMHWGDTVERGSEHLIDGKAYSAEIHYVNWNNQLYKDPKEASMSDNNNGLAVIGQFVQVGKFNAEFEKLSHRMHEIHLKDEQASVNDLDLTHLLPKNQNDYWTYPGSLTTPPCTECVRWIIFKEPIEVSQEQLEKCHELYEVAKEKQCNKQTIIKYNMRPICNLGSRVVLKSFQ